MAKAGAVIRQPVSSGKLRSWTRRIIFYLLLLLIWQAIVSANIWPSYALPGPLDVFQSLINGLSSGQFLLGALVSLQRLIIGYAISLVLGVILGLLIGRYSFFEDTLGSLVLGLQALPSVCWLPLAILWFGLDEQAIIFVVVMGALFSITLGVHNGIKNTPPIYLNAARTLGTRGIALAGQVILPSALPSILSGLKQGWTFAWRSLMAAELLYTTISLGNLLNEGRDFNDVSQVIAVMFVIVFIGIIIDALIFSALERRVRERWGLQN
jgi:NitT/TauT family transport system permease protein